MPNALSLKPVSVGVGCGSSAGFDGAPPNASPPNGSPPNAFVIGATGGATGWGVGGIAEPVDVAAAEAIPNASSLKPNPSLTPAGAAGAAGWGGGIAEPVDVAATVIEVDVIPNALSLKANASLGIFEISRFRLESRSPLRAVVAADAFSAPPLPVVANPSPPNPPPKSKDELSVAFSGTTAGSDIGGAATDAAAASGARGEGAGCAATGGGGAISPMDALEKPESEPK